MISFQPFSGSQNTTGRGVEHVQLPPQPPSLHHAGSGGNRRNPLGQRDERLPVVAGEFQPLRSKPRNDFAQGGLVEPGNAPLP